jgi:hypothetical protein
MPGFNLNNPQSCGNFQGSEVIIFEKAKTEDGQRTVPCNRSDIFSDTIAHELGHLLGLTDQSSSSCPGYIMGQAAIANDG